ncbi:hypothetical protein [Streptomyces mirabilis]|uniref:MmyB family transcriptional regulator n=1 Tax=Streptomyces mirabilis TaxID=68239 RepID=UPI003320A027
MGDLHTRRVGGPVIPLNAVPLHGAVWHVTRVRGTDAGVGILTLTALYAGWPSALTVRCQGALPCPLPNAVDSQRPKVVGRCLGGELLLNCPDFADLWERYDVQGDSYGSKTYQHPEVGTFTLDYQGMQMEGTTGHRLITYYAEPCTPTTTPWRSRRDRAGASTEATALAGAPDETSSA